MHAIISPMATKETSQTPLQLQAHSGLPFRSCLRSRYSRFLSFFFFSLELAVMFAPTTLHVSLVSLVPRALPPADVISAFPTLWRPRCGHAAEESPSCDPCTPLVAAASTTGVESGPGSCEAGHVRHPIQMPIGIIILKNRSGFSNLFETLSRKAFRAFL